MTYSQNGSSTIYRYACSNGQGGIQYAYGNQYGEQQWLAQQAASAGYMGAAQQCYYPAYINTTGYVTTGPKLGPNTPSAKPAKPRTIRQELQEGVDAWLKNVL